MDDLARYKIPSVLGFFCCCCFSVNSLNVIPVSPLEHIVPEDNSATNPSTFCLLSFVVFGAFRIFFLLWLSGIRSSSV